MTSFRTRLWWLVSVFWAGFLFPATLARPEGVVSVAAKVASPVQIEHLLAEARDLEGSETKLALAKASEALAAARETHQQELEAQSLLQCGKLRRVLPDLPGALKNSHEGLDLATALGNQRLMGEFFLLRGLVEWNQSKVPEATVSMMEAYRRGETLGDKGLQLGALYGRGIVRARGDDLDGALETLLPALKLAEETGDARLGQVLNSVGVVYLQRKDYAQAGGYFARAVAALKKGTNLRTLAYAQLNLGQIALETGDQEAAGKYLDTAFAACQKYDFRRGTADVYYLQGARQRRLGNIAEAINQLNQALELAEKLKHPDLFVSIYEEFVQTEQARGDYRAALDYTRKLAEKLEVVRGEKTKRQATEIQARYEAERHAREIKTLQRSRDIQQADIAIQTVQLDQARNGYLYLVVTMVLGGITLAALASRQRAHARLTERMLAETRAADARKAELLTAATKNLRESEDRFQHAIEHTPLGFTIIALDGRWLRVNPAFCRIVGYTEAELLATNFQSITHPDDLESDFRLITQLTAGSLQDYTLEKRYIHKAGHIVWVQISVSMLRRPEDGKPAYRIAQVDDITEQRRAREQLRTAKEVAEKASVAKSEFLSRMSHELRTPLNAILGFSQLLECEDLGERQNQSIAHIGTAGKHLLDLINEVLDITQIENGQLALSAESTPVMDVLRGATLMMEPMAHEAGVELTLAANEQNVPWCIRADPRRLRQVVVNVLANAIQYNRRGGKVRVECEVRHGRIFLQVSDTGAGIAAADREKIFKPFTRLPATESIKGVGLGLSVAKALTEAMGGHIQVTSELGVGSTFILEFDLLSAEESAQESLPLLDLFSEEPAEKPGHETTVLYIEDMVENVELVRYILETLPEVRLINARTGRAGVEMARVEKPDLILLDLNLPDLPGAAVLAQLRRESELTQVPVIILSADASMSQAETLRNLGAKRYIIHPFDLKEFRQVVEEALFSAKQG